MRPALVVVDSIQTVYRPDLASAPGSVAQVRESTDALLDLTKSLPTTTFLVGHVTKEGTVAGPRVLEHEDFDFAASPTRLTADGSRDEILQRFDQNAAALRAALAQAEGERLGASWTLRMGEKVLMNRPRAAVLRATLLSHMIHHRGQLSVYLRLLDVSVPPIYGSSADESAF